MNIEQTIITALRSSSVPISKADMFILCGCETENDERQVRRVIKKIRDIPVGSSDSGYFMVRTKEEKDLANAEDLSRISALRNNIRQREYAYANMNTEVIVRTPSDVVANWRTIPVPEFLR